MSRFSVLLLLAGLVFSGPASAQEAPSITLYDDVNQAVTSSDNSAVFTTLPGRTFGFEIHGSPGSPFSVFLSASKSPFPFEESPPALLLAPPLFPLLVDPNLILGEDGVYSTELHIPQEYSVFDDDLDMYLQGFVQDRNLGFQLTNGVTLRLGYARYKARVVLARVDAGGAIESIGEMWEGNAKDNTIPADDPRALTNGSLLEEADLRPNGVKTPAIDTRGDRRFITPLYLNGIFPLVPGDADAGGNETMDAGSSLYLHVRDRVCRDSENPLLQHLVIPVRDAHGRKIRDLNLYHFFDVTANEGGFMVLDVGRNHLYELAGSRFEGMGERSPWDPHVAVSPDGMLLAAVRKECGVDSTSRDAVYVFRLLEDDLWSDSGSHARRVGMNAAIEEAGGLSTIFPESLTFAGIPRPHLLFFVADRLAPLSDGTGPEGMSELPASLFSVLGSLEESTARYHDFLNATRLPRGGDGISPILLFGDPRREANGNVKSGGPTFLRSEDNGALFMRAGWLFKKNGQNGAEAWSWDILAISNVHCTESECSYTIENVTRFAPDPQKGRWFIPPFGKAYDGSAKAAVSRVDGEGRRYLAFAASSEERLERLYIASDCALDAGHPIPVTPSDRFAGAFAPPPQGEGVGLFDPYFLSPDVLLFFYGRAGGEDGSDARTDLFSYQRSAHRLRNLTGTAAGGEGNVQSKRTLMTPPFSRFGDIEPYGCFPTRDGRYLVFLRGSSQKNKDAPRVNLVGVDAYNHCALIDFTGSEFSRGFAPELECVLPTGAYSGSPAQRMNLVLAPSPEGDRLFFTATKEDDGTVPVYQVFMLALQSPAAASELTSFTRSEPGYVTQIVPDPKGEYVAFTRTAFHENDGREKIHVACLGRSLALMEVTPDSDGRYPGVPLYGSLGFVSNQSITQFVFGTGDEAGISASGNPEEARLWLYPLNDRACKDPHAYPLTEEGRFMVFNILSVAE